jgi:homoserine dehydrogenase
MNSEPLPLCNWFGETPKRGVMARGKRPVRSARVAECRVGLVGFGTVGRSVARILCERAPASLRLTHVCSRRIRRRELDWLPEDVRWTDDVNELLSSNVDVVVELVGGLEPAGEWIRSALRAGKSVVTANKRLIAHCGPELLELAHQMGGQLAFGASVAGGIPVISALQDGLAGDCLLQVRGILNGTCNYVLTEIESAGVSLAAAVEEAQKLGFAEADPSEDLDGLDAAAKLAILARAGLRVQLRVEDVLRRSIRDVAAIDFRYARELGCTIRQVSRAEVSGDSVFAAVQPALVPLPSPLARVQGSQNLVIATGEFGGETVFSGFGAGGDPTAVAVVSDLVSLAKANTNGARPAAARAPKEIRSDFFSPHYVRFTVKDRPGIIASLAAVFSEHQINIDSVLQKPGYPKSSLPFVIAFEACSAALLEQALDKVRPMEFFVQPPVSLPVLN